MRENWVNLGSRSVAWITSERIFIQTCTQFDETLCCWILAALRDIWNRDAPPPPPTHYSLLTHIENNTATVCAHTPTAQEAFKHGVGGTHVIHHWQRRLRLSWRSLLRWGSLLQLGGEDSGVWGCSWTVCVWIPRTYLPFPLTPLFVSLQLGCCPQDLAALRHALRSPHHLRPDSQPSLGLERHEETAFGYTLYITIDVNGVRFEGTFMRTTNTRRRTPVCFVI